MPPSNASVLGRVAHGITSKVPRLVLEIGLGVVSGPSVLGFVSPTPSTAHVADAGAALLLFLVGMHVDTAAMRRVGRTALSVASIGIVAPAVLGFLAGSVTGQSVRASVFLGAALTATSIGITARVFRDAGQLGTTTAQVVIGAAVADDIAGLVLLAAVTFAAGSGEVSVLATSALIIGSFFVGAAVSSTRRAASVESAASRVGSVLVPIFFVHIGMRAEVSSFASVRVISESALVLAVAMASKLVAGWAARGEGIDRVATGLAMAPRGEVGLIFASTALASGAFDEDMYAIVLLVVLATTALTPVLLRRRLAGQ